MSDAESSPKTCHCVQSCMNFSVSEQILHRRMATRWPSPVCTLIYWGDRFAPRGGFDPIESPRIHLSQLPRKDTMSIRVALNHKTEYCYDRLVDLQPHVVRLRPAPHCRTPILSYSLSVEPESHFLNWQQDPYSNYLARLVFLEPTRSFSVEVDLVA